MLSVMSIDQLSSFFAFEPYHLQLTFVGLVIILSFWLPRLCSRKEPVAAPLMRSGRLSAARIATSARSGQFVSDLGAGEQKTRRQQ